MSMRWTSFGDRLFCGFDHEFCWARALIFADSFAGFRFKSVLKYSWCMEHWIGSVVFGNDLHIVRSV